MSELHSCQQVTANEPGLEQCLLLATNQASVDSQLEQAQK